MVRWSIDSFFCWALLTTKSPFLVCCLDPKNAPILPRNAVGAVARFGFHALTIPLIYSTIAKSVSIDSLGDYWFMLVAGFGVISVSYLIATLLGRLLPLSNPRDFVALRIAATFPNIVALPILIFPSLCEYKVLYEGFAPQDDDNESSSSTDLVEECISQSNTMIFLYFLSWSICFWSLGHPQLMNAAKATQQQKRREDDAQLASTTRMEQAPSRSIELATVEEATNEEEVERIIEQPVTLTTCQEGRRQDQITQQSPAESAESAESADTTEPLPSFLHNFGKALKQTFTSPGFLAMVAGFITACIPPLQKALFDTNGPLRFLGAAGETLGLSSAAVSTMVVAASLVKPSAPIIVEPSTVSEEEPIPEENPAMSDPNFGPSPRRRRRSSLREVRQSMRSGSMRMLQAVPRSTPEIRRMHLWFTLSRLILTPAVVVGVILALDDCGAGVLGGVPAIAKLVVIVNSSLPGALIIVVVLKGNPDLSETAAAVAKVYFPSYLLSIVTISAWTAVGLYVTIPNEEGLSFCQRI
jgi:predicted permease